MRIVYFDIDSLRPDLRRHDYDTVSFSNFADRYNSPGSTKRRFANNNLKRALLPHEANSRITKVTSSLCSDLSRPGRNMNRWSPVTTLLSVTWTVASDRLNVFVE